MACFASRALAKPSRRCQATWCVAFVFRWTNNAAHGTFLQALLNVRRRAYLRMWSSISEIFDGDDDDDDDVYKELKP
jgi:hypothetical protein